MKDFNNIALLTRVSRNKIGLSQMEAANRMGFKNGQFVSNIERGLCGIPEKRIYQFCSSLFISLDDVIDAILKDHTDYLIRQYHREMLRLNQPDDHYEARL